MKTTFKNPGIIIQARMGSTRLPSKILLPVKGLPVFSFQLNRLRKTGIPLYIATTDKPQDDVIMDFAKEQGIQAFRGDENNVMSRYLGCAKHFDIDVIVRATSDCPLIDAVPIEQVVKEYMQQGNPDLYYSNTIERTFPRGFDFEVFSRYALEQAAAAATETSDLEHVTPYLWKNKSSHTVIRQFKASEDNSRFRLTLDTPEDLELLQLLIEKYDADQLSGVAIIQIMQQHPELERINAHIEQKKA